MELTLENFEKQLNKLNYGEYFVIEDEDGYGFVISKMYNIARYFLIGYWELTETLKMYSEDNYNVSEMYEFINETYLEPNMNIISNIRQMNQTGYKN